MRLLWSCPYRFRMAMVTTLKQLINVRSRLADDVVLFCQEAERVLDATPFHFREPSGGSRPVSISGTVVDARVFTERIERTEREKEDHPRPQRARRGDEAEVSATEYEKQLADLNEHPWQTAQRESIRGNEGEISDGDDTRARVTVGFAEGI